MLKTKKVIALVLLLMLFLSGCGSQVKELEDPHNENLPIDNGQAISEDAVEENEAVENDYEEAEEVDNVDPKENIDLSLKPNEAGEVMVLMYHNIGEKEDTWVRTPDNFRRDLKTLYEKGYRPISIEDFVTNNIEVEQGYTPVLIVFDDGNQNNLNIIEENGDKKVDPNSAVGILEAFHEEHPDFPLEATFFVFGTNPFRQKELVEYKLQYLIDKGFDIGNHTFGHDDLTKLRSEELQRVIGKNVAFLEGILEGYKINTFALPYGSRPNKEYYDSLQKGEYEGTTYDNIAIFNVGWKPSVSPINKDFNPYAIHRVRASEMNVDGVGMYNWLEYFDKNPHKKYISDGNPDIITVPKNLEDEVNKEKFSNKEFYIYE